MDRGRRGPEDGRSGTGCHRPPRAPGVIDRVPPPVPTPRLAALAPLALVALVLGGTLSACAGADRAAPPATPATAAASPVAIPELPVVAEVPAGEMRRPTQAEFDAAWATRPAYVTDLPAEWQSAYAYALARPDVLQWLPCYCGCGGMGHRSNLDCFFQRREDSFAWEEHASFCDICVETATWPPGS